MTYYKGYEILENEAKDAFDSLHLKTTWSVKYAQERKNPIVNIL